ncbi:MAG: hypothetical protein Q9168_004169 [Polycauliona sp. 1 TL-2023]
MGQVTIHVPDFEKSLFHQSLKEHSVGPSQNEDIYEYYKDRYKVDARATPLSHPKNVIYERNEVAQILAADASDTQTNPESVNPWIRRTDPVGKGSQATVWVWEKQPNEEDNQEPLRLAVKDAKLHKFWKDEPSEGILLDKLLNVGCDTVLTVYDYLYKERTRSNEDSIIRILEEYAEYGDLYSLFQFYTKNRLIIPEAFVWKAFWSGANTLCYFRHGTIDSETTVKAWDPIVHMDIKPHNLLMTKPDSSSADDLYPSIKLGDFGGAYTLPATGYTKIPPWKSTFNYGTAGFQAPEAGRNHTKEGSFAPVNEKDLHGSHTDIFSLGKTIITLMDGSAHAVGGHEEVNINHVYEYYSPAMQRLVIRCTSLPIDKRPGIHELLQQTTEGMKKYRRIARKERTDAGQDSPFHSQVLYDQVSQARFASDAVFKERYETVNRAPLKDGIKTADPGEEEVQQPEIPDQGNANQRTEPLNDAHNDDDELFRHPSSPLSSLPSSSTSSTPSQPPGRQRPQQGIEIRVNPPTAAQSQSTPITRPQAGRPRQAPTNQAQPPRRPPPQRQPKAPKPATTTSSPTEPKTKTKRRGKPASKKFTAKKAQKTTPKPQPTGSKITKSQRKPTTRTTNPRNSPVTQQTLSITRIPLVKPYTASVRAPPFLPGATPPVPEIVTVDVGGRKRKSDDDDGDAGVSGRGKRGKNGNGRSVRFVADDGQEEEDEEEDEDEDAEDEEEDEVISVSSGESSDTDSDLEDGEDGNEDGSENVVGDEGGDGNEAADEDSHADGNEEGDGHADGNEDDNADEEVDEHGTEDDDAARGMAARTRSKSQPQSKNGSAKGTAKKTPAKAAAKKTPAKKTPAKKTPAKTPAKAAAKKAPAKKAPVKKRPAKKANGKRR